MDPLIIPRTLKGFRDFLPAAESRKKSLIQKLEQVFELFGFVPIDTPALEYSDVLLGKSGGETDKQVYRFLDHGARDVALRNDLTVPFARFIAAHRQELYLPFKRYHIAKVWRGENTQRGRYREFTQCDFDIVGTDSLSADFEILLVMARSLAALDIGPFHIHLSHRGVFNRLLQRLNLDDRSLEILKTVDKLNKVGLDKVRESLSAVAGGDSAKSILNFIEPVPDFGETLSRMIEEAGGQDEDTARLGRLKELIRDLGMEATFRLDPSITRGLDYYTGIVFETFLEEQPELGSICSGGRYNNLASLYTKEIIPGVGSSIGMDRLCASLDKSRAATGGQYGPVLLIINMDERFLGYYHETAARFRNEGIASEIYPEKKKMARQFQYAEKKGIPLALICGEEERGKNTVIIKDLITRQSYKGLSIDAALSKAADLVATSLPRT